MVIEFFARLKNNEREYKLNPFYFYMGARLTWLSPWHFPAKSISSDKVLHRFICKSITLHKVHPVAIRCIKNVVDADWKLLNVISNESVFMTQMYAESHINHPIAGNSSYMSTRNLLHVV